MEYLSTAMLMTPNCTHTLTNPASAISDLLTLEVIRVMTYKYQIFQLHSSKMEALLICAICQV